MRTECHEDGAMVGRLEWGERGGGGNSDGDDDDGYIPWSILDSSGYCMTEYRIFMFDRMKEVWFGFVF